MSSGCVSSMHVNRCMETSHAETVPVRKESIWNGSREC